MKKDSKGFILVTVSLLSALLSSSILILSKNSNNLQKDILSIEEQHILMTEIQSLSKILIRRLRFNQISLPIRENIGHIKIHTINSNSLLNINTASAEELKNILQKIGENELNSQNIAAAIIDFRDKDNDTTLGGAERNYYEYLNPGYECPNSFLQSKEQLIRIKGMDQQLAERLEHLVCFDSKGINLQQAPQEVLFALLGDQTKVEKLIKYREERELDNQSLRMLLGENDFLPLLTQMAMSASKSNLLTLEAQSQGVFLQKSIWVTSN